MGARKLSSTTAALMLCAALGGCGASASSSTAGPSHPRPSRLRVTVVSLAPAPRRTPGRHGPARRQTRPPGLTVRVVETQRRSASRPGAISAVGGAPEVPADAAHSHRPKATVPGVAGIPARLTAAQLGALARDRPCARLPIAAASRALGRPVSERTMKLGPTCLLQTRSPAATATVAVQTIPVARELRLIGASTADRVGPARAYCGRLALPLVIVPLSGSLALQVTAPCRRAMALAAAWLAGAAHGSARR